MQAAQPARLEYGETWQYDGSQEGRAMHAGEPLGDLPAAKASVTALLFPGQGSQNGYVLDSVWTAAPELAARAVVEVGADPFKRAEHGTRFLQPALYCASIAAWIRMGRPLPRFVAGYSLGEFAALAVAGSFSVEEGLRLVTIRGRLMQRAMDNAPAGGMIVVSGLGERAIQALSRRHGLTIAGDNCPGQMVLAGESVALGAAAVDAASLGARCSRLAVPGSFHSDAVQSTAAEFEEVLRDADIRQPRLGAFCCTTGGLFDDVRARLLDGFSKRVEWRSTLLALHRAGARRFVDVGPGNGLTRLVQRTLPTAVVGIPVRD
jgi:[acyl-carrier-protein] S-malonyltransferase